MGLVRILELWLTGCFLHILNSLVLSNHPVFIPKEGMVPATEFAKQ